MNIKVLYSNTPDGHVKVDKTLFVFSYSQVDGAWSYPKQDDNQDLNQNFVKNGFKIVNLTKSIIVSHNIPYLLDWLHSIYKAVFRIKNDFMQNKKYTRLTTNQVSKETQNTRLFPHCCTKSIKSALTSHTPRKRKKAATSNSRRASAHVQRMYSSIDQNAKLERTGVFAVREPEKLITRHHFLWHTARPIRSSPALGISSRLRHAAAHARKLISFSSWPKSRTDEPSGILHVKVAMWRSRESDE